MFGPSSPRYDRLRRAWRLWVIGRNQRRRDKQRTLETMAHSTDHSPVAPVNVMVETDDGVRHPVQTVFMGYDLEHTAIWQIVDPPPGTPLTIHIEMMPGQTEVRLAL